MAVSLSQREYTNLPENRLLELVQFHYGLTVRNVIPFADKWQLETIDGSYTLSRVTHPDSAYWELIERLLTHIQRSDLQSFPRIVRTHSGKVMFSGFRSRYVLWQRQHGSRCHWHDPVAWAGIGRTLAKLHVATRDFPLQRTDDKYRAAGNWQYLWEHAAARLDAIRTACDLSSERQPVDELWLDMHTYTVTMIETAHNYLAQSGGDDSVLSHLSESIIGQHLLRRKSWGVAANGHYRLLDWEQTVIDIPVRDLAQMIHLARGSKQAFRERVSLLLEGYLSIRPLKATEWPLLYARLLFPEPMVQTVRAIYDQRHMPKSDDAVSLRRAMKEQRRREWHLRLLPMIFQEVASVTIPPVDWLHTLD